MPAWPALLLSPLFALASIGGGYALVTPACRDAGPWLLHLCIAFFLALSLGATASAWRAFARARREFLPLVAAWTGVFFSAVIAVQWVAVLFIGPCRS